MSSLSRGASGCLPARGRISSSETVPSAVRRRMTSSEYGWKEEENKKSEKGFLEQLTLEEELVYRFCCTENEVTSEEILQQSGLSVVKLTMLLLQLQLKGYIREVGSGRYIVTRKD